MNTQPFVSVIVPALNEEDYISGLLESLAKQTYTGPFEVIVADGGSDDRTREIVTEGSHRYGWLRLIDNPGRTQSHAFNLGLAEARGEVIGYVGAHSELAPDFLEQTVRALESSGAAGVGGRWDIRPTCDPGPGIMLRLASATIAVAMNSPFGPGTADYRWRKTGRETDTVLYGFYHRAPLEQVGGINPRLKINEDYELNIRLRDAGHRLYYSPDIRITYFCRTSLGRLWRQYLAYGFWKTRVIQLHPASLQARHLAAPLFCAGLVAGLPLAMAFAPASRIYLGVLSLYVALSVLFSISLAVRHGWRHLPILPVVFATLHIAWGAGFLAGIWHWWIRRSGNRGIEAESSNSEIKFDPTAAGETNAAPVGDRGRRS